MIYELPENRNWQALYKAAIVEVDRTTRLSVSRQRKEIMVERAKQLFQPGGDNFAEEQALDAAIGVLHAFMAP